MSKIQIVKGLRYPNTAEYKMAMSCMRDEIQIAREHVANAMHDTDRRSGSKHVSEVLEAQIRISNAKKTFNNPI